MAVKSCVKNFLCRHNKTVITLLYDLSALLLIPLADKEICFIIISQPHSIYSQLTKFLLSFKKTFVDVLGIFSQKKLFKNDYHLTL